MMENIELLAPAGDMNSLIAAVENGTDAVYLGGKNFSARQYAGNFNEQELALAVDYCHIRGVKVYATVNTLLKDSEIKELPQYAGFLYNTGVDALIVQDIGVGELIRKILPKFELHASTQMTAHNLESVNFLYSLGYNRVVLSRELSLDEIKFITSNTQAEIEVFVHGALCICYSGQCLMSSMIGGRSGNRGRCAQPCRQKYRINFKDRNIDEKYFISPKDLSTIEHIDLLLNSGIKSLKVEGRMKKPEYVAAIISIYRKAIDQYKSTGQVNISEEDKKDLLKIFNRGGFTTAHLFGKGGHEMMSFERPKNWGIYLGEITRINTKNRNMETSLKEGLSKGDGIEIWTGKGENPGYRVQSMWIDGKPVDHGLPGEKVTLDYKGGKKGDKVYKTFDAELNKRLESTYKSKDPLRKIPVDCRVAIKEKVPFEISLWDGDGNEVTVKGPVPEAALRVPLTEDKIKEQLMKLGGTPLFINSINIELGENLSLPISTINGARREAVEKLLELRLKRAKPEEVNISQIECEGRKILSLKEVEKNKKPVKISVHIRDTGLIEAAINGGADIIVFGGDKLRGYHQDYNLAVKKCKELGVEIFLASPRIIRKEFPKVVQELREGMENGAAGIHVENLGILKYAEDNHIPFSSGFSLNVFNSMSAGILQDMGSKFVSLSPELSLEQISHIAPYIENCEALCYGRVEMMVSEYCPVSAVNGGSCKNTGSGAICEDGSPSLVDRYGLYFPVKTDIFCRSHIYNSKILSMLENIEDIKDCGIKIIRLNMLEEDEGDIYRIVRAFKEALAWNGKGEMPENLLNTVQYIKNMGYTKGHYYRGVE